MHVPTNLPKFRGDGLKDPEEFLDAFRRTMEAHGIQEDRYLKILKLCLDSIDNDWLESVKGTWRDVKDAFVKHFKDPNKEVAALKELEQLKVVDGAIQRYADRFFILMREVGWDQDSSMAIYQFQKGLPRRMEDSINGAIVAFEAVRGRITVKDVASMAVGIESRKDRSGWLEKKFSLKPELKNEHVAVVHDSKPSKQDIVDSMVNGTNSYKSLASGEKTLAITESKTPGADHSLKRCYNCGKHGHIAAHCSRMKSGYSVAIQSEFQDGTRRSGIT